METATEIKKEYPILFSAEMVRAILDGRKTQTRRVVKYQDELDFIGCSGDDVSDPQNWAWRRDGNGRDEFCMLSRSPDHDYWARCPHGRPGDHLWVRETCRLTFREDRESYSVEYRADGEQRCIDKTPDPDEAIIAWCEKAKWYDDPAKSGVTLTPWRPSIHMPRVLSRITLEITDVRVQRVQEISPDDCLAEGSFLGQCPCPEMNRVSRAPIVAAFRQTGCHKHGTEFKVLWDSINAKRGYSWASNPWVWAITFKRIKPE